MTYDSTPIFPHGSSEESFPYMSAFAYFPLRHRCWLYSSLRPACGPGSHAVSWAWDPPTRLTPRTPFLLLRPSVQHLWTLPPSVFLWARSQTLKSSPSAGSGHRGLALKVTLVVRSHGDPGHGAVCHRRGHHPVHGGSQAVWHLGAHIVIRR